MLNPYLTVTAVIAGSTLLQGASGLLLVLLPMRMSAEQFPVQMIGWVAAAHGGGFLLGCTMMGRLIMAIGHVRAFAALAATLAAVVLAFAAFREPLAWVGLRLVGGACFAGLFTVAESWIADRTPQLLRGRVLSFYTVCTKASLVTAPLFLTNLDLDGPWAFMLVSALCSLSLLPVTTTRSASPTVSRFSALGVRELYRLAPVGLIGCLAVGLINAPLLSLAPVYGEGIGLDVGSIVLLFPVLQLGSLVFQWPLGRWSDRGDRRRLIAGLNLAVTAVTLLIWAFGAPPSVVLMPMLFLLGGVSLSVYAICVAHAGDHARPEQMVPLVSTLLLAWGLGAVIGPAAAAAAMEWLGPQGLFLYLACVALAFSAFVFWRMRRRAPVPDEEHVHFVDLPATSPAVIELGVTDAISGKAESAEQQDSPPKPPPGPAPREQD